MINSRIKLAVFDVIYHDRDQGKIDKCMISSAVILNIVRRTYSCVVGEWFIYVRACMGGDRGWVLYFFDFLFCFCVVVNCSLVAST